MRHRTFVGAGDRLGIPARFKPCLEDGIESQCVNPHCGDEGTVVTILVEVGPGCSETGVGKEVHLSEILPVGMSIAYRLRVILVGSNDQDHSEKVRLLRDFSFFINFEVTLGGEVTEEQEVIVVHG